MRQMRTFSVRVRHEIDGTPVPSRSPHATDLRRVTCGAPTELAKIGPHRSRECRYAFSALAVQRCHDAAVFSCATGVDMASARDTHKD
jgi:hypothetical protein